MSDEMDRIKIWNSYLIEAHSFATKLKECNANTKISNVNLSGGNLTPEQHYSMMTILHSALAVEARVNHHLHILKEEGKITKKYREAVKNLNIKFKWLILPQVADKHKKINENRWPHKAIIELYRYRNQFVHAQYQRIDFIGQIPSKQETIQIYNYFVEAMEDMNVALGIKRKKRVSVINKLQV